MVLEATLAASLAGCVPARWPSSDPVNIDLLTGTPVNCVLVERPQWSAAFSKAAQAAKLTVLGVVRDASDSKDCIARAKAAGIEALVLQGDFDKRSSTALCSELPCIHLPSRSRLDVDSATQGIAGTSEGVWPGIRLGDGDSLQAGPTGPPWIDTNGGVLRFLRSATDAAVWMANAPPVGAALHINSYLTAIADAGAAGARWVVSLDQDFWKRLLARESNALAGWQRISDHLRFFETYRKWSRLKPAGHLAVLQDTGSGALISGGLLDMIGARHTPVRPIATRALTADRLEGIRVLVDIEPDSVPEHKRAILNAFKESGNIIITPEPGFRFPRLPGFQMSLEMLSRTEHERLDGVWKQVTAAIGRRNLGARVFNASGMLSTLLKEDGSTRQILFLVNYTDYQAESITVWLPSRIRKARLHMPGGRVEDLGPYIVEEGWGVDIQRIDTVAALEFE